MHAKERVISPIVERELGLSVVVANGVDTDRFGTFSGETERTGSQLDAAKAKIAAGLAAVPQARIGLASEGSFGPHPHFPFLAVGRELVLMMDRDTGFELSGSDLTARTNFGHALVRDLTSAHAFAARGGFPDHGMIVLGCRGDQPAPDLMINKDIGTDDEFASAVMDAISACGVAFIQTDMRAHRNPSRIASIERATQDLVRRFHSRCPNCDARGYDVVEHIGGLPCAWCAMPTHVIRANVLICIQCGHREQKPVSGATVADPGQCGHCNP